MGKKVAVAAAFLLWAIVGSIWPAVTVVYGVNHEWSTGNIVLSVIAMVIMEVLVMLGLFFWGAAEGDRVIGSRAWLPLVIGLGLIALGIVFLIMTLL